MSLLWKVAANIQRQAAPWYHDPHMPPPQGKSVPARSVGYAGLVALRDPDDYRDPEEDHSGGFDEDLYEETTPEPTKEEQAHYEEHGEHPESFYERHDHAYARAIENKRREDEPDHEDYGLGEFVAEHASDGEVWRQHGHFGPVSLKQPVYATQSHVHTGHLDRIDAGDTSSWHLQHGGHHGDYLANEHPLFATHEGRLHVVDGHHRVGAALRRGDASVHGWHIDLDHPGLRHMTDPWAED